MWGTLSLDTQHIIVLISIVFRFASRCCDAIRSTHTGGVPDPFNQSTHTPAPDSFVFSTPIETGGSTLPHTPAEGGHDTRPERGLQGRRQQAVGQALGAVRISREGVKGGAGSGVSGRPGEGWSR